MTEDSDRRRSPRAQVAAIVSLETRGVLNANDQALGAVRNMSRTGIGLETGQPPLVGQTVILRLVLDEESHELRTRATRVQRRGRSNFYEVGLDWSNCATHALAFLDRVLRAFEQQPSR